MKKVLATILIALTVICGVSAMDVTLGFEGKTNGFELNAAQEEKTTALKMDAALDAKIGFYGKSGFGGYTSVGYFFNNMQTILPDPLPSVSKSQHGITGGLGISYVTDISRNWDFVISTGLGIAYNFTSEVMTMTYDADLNLHYMLGSKAYLDFGVGYKLDFLTGQNNLKDEFETETHVIHQLSVPTIGFGVKF